MQLKFRKNTQRFGQGALLKVGERTGLFLFISGTLVWQVLEEGRLSTCKLYVCIYNRYIECYSVATAIKKTILSMATTTDLYTDQWLSLIYPS